MFNLKIHNFRSFQNQNFNFSRINILIGENSGGKSSLLKLLMALKQTIDSPTEVNLKLSGDYTDLGNFDGVIYKNKRNSKINIGFESGKPFFEYFQNSYHNYIDLNKTKENKSKKILETLKNSTTKIYFELSSNLADHSSIKTIIENDIIGKIELIQKKNKDDSNQRQRSCDIKYSFDKSAGILENCPAFKEGFFTLFSVAIEDICKNSQVDDYFYTYFNVLYLLVFQNFIDEQIDKIRFVNPIGTTPKRFYFQEDRKAAFKLIDIEKFINILSDRTLTEKQYNDRIQLLNETIKKFGIAEQIDIIKDKQLPVLALKVKTKDFWSNITDVGYGVSLQLPILFQALMSENYTKHGETLLIEQPEVHLHPTLQAKFIETLLGIGSKNTYFIETHSEHIIRKMQILVKNKTFNLKPEDITIHYFRRDSNKFNITEHKINANGTLNHNFPDGFFDTSYSLVKQLF